MFNHALLYEMDRAGKFEEIRQALNTCRFLGSIPLICPISFYQCGKEVMARKSWTQTAYSGDSSTWLPPDGFEWATDERGCIALCGILRSSPEPVHVARFEADYFLNVLPPIYARGCFACSEPVDTDPATGLNTYNWFGKCGLQWYGFYGTRPAAEAAFRRLSASSK